MSLERSAKRRVKTDDDYYYDTLDEPETPPSEKRKKRAKGAKYDNEKHDNSLGVLTKQFVELIQKQDKHCIDLNEAVKHLKVQKRRIYDITNVLEGIGLIQKTNKNKIQWTGNCEGYEDTLTSELREINNELQELEQEERNLDGWKAQIQDLMNQLTKDASYEKYAYITNEDIKSLPNLTNHSNEALIAIRAPTGTSLEVPDAESFPPEEREKYQIHLNSRVGEIMVYMISNDKLNFEESRQSFPFRIPASRNIERMQDENEIFGNFHYENH
ncbi:unnamed protein product [Blepharisma stoltei]|uniref:E2F/DP family winged-helix DNA-binding domain-containing protein n=1 Tax=Blepharisma stoltei TaxID=1481888 RepID=A0AAU9JIV5_9CILI|nr:unnamed protein product [Blepharisma stoltei]